MGSLTTRSAALLVIVSAGVFGTRSLAQPTSVTEGHRLALLICASCHVVASDQEHPPTLRKPARSFVSIANRRGVTAESVGNFLRTTHSTMTPPLKMPNPKLADYQIDAIVSYLLSLKGQH
jgi:mono/diheme cytochrome c family protein